MKVPLLHTIYNSEEELFLGEEEVEVFHAEQEKLFKEDSTFYKVTVGDSNARIGPRMPLKALYMDSSTV